MVSDSRHIVYFRSAKRPYTNSHDVFAISVVQFANARGM